VNPADLLAERQRDYAKARDRHRRALEVLQQAQEHTQDLECELADAEDADRRALGDALVDGRKPPAGKTERVRSALGEAKQQLEALQYAAERAGQELDRMPTERKQDWLRQTKRDFEAARGDYENRLASVVEAYERLAQEAALISFLNPESPVHPAPVLRVHVGGVEGLVRDVPVADVLRALRDQLYDLEADVLVKARA
jgi:tetratricopeptide (TPR) repeat protein